MKVSSYCLIFLRCFVVIRELQDFTYSHSSLSSCCETSINRMSSSANDEVGQVSAVHDIGGEDFDQTSARNADPAGNVGNNITPLVRPLRGEFNRLMTFPLVWEGSYTKETLAMNGFYYAGQGVWCKCLFCDHEMEAINTGNSLEYHHKIISADCEFAQNRKTDNIPIGEATDYRIEKNRLISFLRVSWSDPIDPFELAKWGFFRPSTTNAARCFYCRLEVMGFEPGDSAESEHRRRMPTCLFLLGEPVGNVPREKDEFVQKIINGMARLYDSVREFMTPYKHREYSTLDSRLRSYVTWPSVMKQRISELCEAGFFYTGKGDRVKCFCCGGGLRDWSPVDLPWVEHAVWFSHCSYLQWKKGQGFIDQVLTLKAAHLGDQVAETGQFAIGQASGHLTTLSEPAALSEGTVNPELIEQSVEHQNEQDMEAPEVGRAAPQIVREAASGTGRVCDLRLCKVCYEEELGIIFLPCRHLATGYQCAPELTKCPICRTQAKAFVRASLPK